MLQGSVWDGAVPVPVNLLTVFWMITYSPEHTRSTQWDRYHALIRLPLPRRAPRLILLAEAVMPSD
jgi:hypothetical protein